MKPEVVIPDGDRKVTVELTLKEAMALSGIRFNGNQDLKIAARKRIKNSLDQVQLEAK